MRLIQSAFVIARRDYSATVFSRTFLLFLIGPIFPFLIVLMFGGIGAKVAEEAQRPVVAVVFDQADFNRFELAHTQIANALEGAGLVGIRHFDPQPDVLKQREELLRSTNPPVLGVLDGSLSAPRFTGSAKSDNVPRQLELLIGAARAGGAASADPKLKVVTTGPAAGSIVSARAITARAGQAILFLLTILLAGMLLSQLIEEKSNKVIEILAAAVPMDSIFVGKLFAMLAVSLTGIAVWGLTAAVAVGSLASDGLSALPPPAVGWPLFVLLALLYFVMSYLLLGAAFLGIGAQASTVREVQTLSMPVTMAQVIIFALASSAVGAADSGIGRFAAAFPLSSPYVMLARAAESAELWPHAVALLWQALWVALILHFAARLFRRSVLKSGPARRWFRRRSASLG